MMDRFLPYEILDSLVEDTDHIWLVTDKKGEVLWAPPSISQLFGVNPAEVKGEIFTHYLNGPATKEDTLADLSESMEKLRAFSFDVEYYSQSGKPGRLHLKGKPVADASKKVTHFLLRLTPLQEMTGIGKEMEGVAITNGNKAASLEFFKRAINASSLVSATDRKGTITYVNDRFAQVSGYTKEELLGQNHRIINSGLHHHEFWQEMWKTIGSGKIWRKEIRNKKKDGTHYWVDTFIIPYLDEKGKVQEYLSIRNLITLRKRNEEALKVAVEERDLLMKELHHRVKNNLQLILSMLFLQELKMSESGAYHFLKGIQSRKKTMSLLHESFFESKNIWQVSARSYLAKLIEQVAGVNPYTNDLLSIEQKLEDVTIEIEKLVVLGLLLNELLMNSFRHAFKEDQQGNIHVLFQEMEVGTYRLVYRDDGIGLDLQEKEKQDENAFLMEKMLSDQLGAKFKISTAPGEGFRASIKFSVK